MGPIAFVKSTEEQWAGIAGEWAGILRLCPLLLIFFNLVECFLNIPESLGTT